jgi:Fic family protein
MYEVAIPPNWKEVMQKDGAKLQTLLQSVEFHQLLTKANQKYLHWEKFRYQPMPAGASPELAWAFLKVTRLGNREVLPLKDEKGNVFSIFLTKEHLKGLSYIDTYTSGIIATKEQFPSGQQKDQLIISGLMEEAISSSQIEGANTTRKAAKAMIELKRQPKNTDERMIFNNYVAMMHLEDWKKRRLDDGFLLELHRVLTKETMDDPADEGRFRVDGDQVVVQDKLTGNVVHTPPNAEDAATLLKQLYAFANNDDDENYIHPFVKASILHFCLAYIHPFVDGNGRSARALFYWYLIKKDYWMFKFLPISLQIKKKNSRPAYDRAFQFVETDEGDLTYFLSYKIKLATSAIEDFIKYLERKEREATQLKQKLLTNDEINHRQLDVIELLQRNPHADVDVESHKERHKVVYQTARTDLLGLASKGILRQAKVGKKYVFTRGENFPSS